MTHRFRAAVAATLVALVVAPLLATPASADTVSTPAIAWLAAHQQTDGGFEIAQFPPFETPDAILAIAEDAQTTTTWDAEAARDAVEALDANGPDDGGTPLDWADDYLDAHPPGAGIAAKFIVLVAGPLGLDPTAFDPAGDLDEVDLVAAMDAGLLEDGSYGAGALNDTLYALQATRVIGGAAPADTVAYVRAAQQASGGWSYDGATSGTDPDVDTTARAVQALAAAGLPAGDATVAAALKFLADRQAATGAWQSFGADDTNSTAMALVGLVAAGWRPSSSCWRTSSSSAAPATGYVNPATWLRSQQVTTGLAEDLGRFLSPNDAFSDAPNSSATTQAVQALLRHWLPVAAAPAARNEGFTDVPSCAWYTQAVAWMADNGITRSTTGAFGPKNTITNGQLALLLWNLMDHPTSLPAHHFTDVPANAAYGDAVDWMVDEGLVADGGTFAPKRMVNRGRLVNLLWRLAGSPAAPDLTIPDVAPGAPYADAVDWAVDTGVATLLPDGRFLPRNKVTRAQAAVMMHRLASTEPAWGDVTQPATVEF